MIRKTILLFLALLLPVTIFLFLHFFGKNEFEVPVLFQSATEIPSTCGGEFTFPYQVNSQQVSLKRISVILFASSWSQENCEEVVFQLARLEDEFGDRAPVVVALKQSSDSLFHFTNEIILSDSVYQNEKNCVFFAGENRIVLVDEEKHIRGLYPEASLKEMDRLLLELKIIFKEY